MTNMEKNHENNFQTPEGYFESFNERLFARLDAEEGEPNTDFLPKTDGFAVPEDYFESLPTKIIEKTIESTPKVVRLQPKRRFYYSAASVAAIFVLALLIFQNNEPAPTFEDLASSDIDAYFEENEIELSSYELAEVINIENISVADMTEEDLQGEEILEYLDENLDEIEDLNLDYDENF